MITIAERVHIPHPPEVVWSVLSDPSRVVACIEGSQLGGYHDDGSFDVQLAVRFAAIRVAFTARANLDLDEANRTGRLDARGGDTRGSTRVQGYGTFGVTPDEQGSVVDIDGRVELKGPLASLVATGGAVVVQRMTRSFATQLTATCAELDPNSAPAEPPTVGRSWSGRLVALLRHAGAAVRRAWQRLVGSAGSRQGRRIYRGGAR